MALVTIDLPDTLEAKLRTRLEDAGYANPLDYLQDLIEADLDHPVIAPPDRVVVRSQEELEAKLLEGLNSGPSVEMTPADWAELRRNLVENYLKRVAT